MCKNVESDNVKFHSADESNVGSPRQHHGNKWQHKWITYKQAALCDVHRLKSLSRTRSTKSWSLWRLSPKGTGLESRLWKGESHAQTEFLSQSHYSLQSCWVKSTMKFCRKTQRCLKLIFVHHQCTTMAQSASDLSRLCFSCREDVRIASYTAVGDVTCLVIDREWEGLFVSTINRFLHGGQVSWKRHFYALIHSCFSQVF